MRFMASIVIKPPSNIQELKDLGPAEQARVGELLRSGAVEAAHVASQRLRAWLVLQADSAEAAHATLATLPMHRFMEIDLVPLDERH